MSPDNSNLYGLVRVSEKSRRASLGCESPQGGVVQVRGDPGCGARPRRNLGALKRWLGGAFGVVPGPKIPPGASGEDQIAPKGARLCAAPFAANLGIAGASLRSMLANFQFRAYPQRTR